MFFDGWEKHKKETISKDILWEYDTTSPRWDWNKMSRTVVARVIERGRPEDYIAMFQLYGGVEQVKEIVKNIPYFSDKDMNWCCVLFHIKKEELWSYRRMLLRKELLNS